MNRNYPNIYKILELTGKMDTHRPEYEKEIRCNQEYLKQAICELESLADDYSIFYAHMIQQSIDSWWDWINDSKQIQLF